MQLQGTVSRLPPPKGFQPASAGFSAQREERTIFFPATRDNLGQDSVVKMRAGIIVECASHRSHTRIPFVPNSQLGSMSN
jgi:hypothetical protein